MASSSPPLPRRAVVLQLEEDLNLNKKLFHVHVGEELVFTLAPALHGRTVHLACNYPPQPDVEFKRDTFYHMPWENEHLHGDEKATILLTRSGCYNFVATVVGVGADAAAESKDYQGTFLVDPQLTLNSRPLPPSALVIQTVIPRCLGPLSEWEGRLRVSQHVGYNMIHFTPVQEIGWSGSAYSLRNQARIEPSFFPGESLSDEEAMSRLSSFIAKLRKPVDDGGLGMLSLVDVVWNHTSTDSPWLREHPEAGYNLTNSPHLVPAYVLDAGLKTFSDLVVEGRIPNVSADIHSEDDIRHILGVCRSLLVEKLRLWEFFIVDVDRAVSEFADRLHNSQQPHDGATRATEVKVVRNHNGRFGHHVDLQSAMDVCCTGRHDGESDETYTTRCTSALRKALELHNLAEHRALDADMDTAFMHMFHTLVWERLDAKGPRKGPITLAEPLVTAYFTRIGANHPEAAQSPTLERCPTESPDYAPSYIVAHNGWIWDGDPLQDFAAFPSRRYLRREVIVWGDSVKLRYGRGPEDSPYLWEHMARYTRQMATVFDGLRIDNCHSTPLHVGQYLVDEARAVNPDIYVIAELFTGSADTDNLFTNTLGLTSIIREALASHNAPDLSRVIHRFGGRPIGSFQNFMCPMRILTPAVPFAIFMDATHDNMTPEELFTVHSSLPIAALVAMVNNAIGSNRGFDELFPVRAQVVNERKLYRSWSSAPSTDDPKLVDASDGILAAKAVLNRLHERLAVEHFDEIYVDDMGDGIISVTRHSPITLRAVTVVTNAAHTRDELYRSFRGKPPIRTGGIVTNIILAARAPQPWDVKDHVAHDAFLNGRRFQVDMQHNVAPHACTMADVSGSPNKLTLTDFPPGSVLVYEVMSAEESSGLVKAVLARIGWALTGLELAASDAQQALKDIVDKLSLVDLNYALYRAKQEEETREYSGDRAYDIPGFGTLVYNGLQGLMSVLEDVRVRNDLAHPICANLREGNWLMDFIAGRLLDNPHTHALGTWLRATFDLIAKLPRSVVPVHFALCVSEVYYTLVRRAWSEMAPFVQGGSSLVRALALVSVQLYGHDAPFARNPLPSADNSNGSSKDFNPEWGMPTLAAGLPHFASGWKRSWGRDTFIAFRGLFLVTGRYSEARDTLLFYASVLRHGLMPNLLDGGKNPRYNCRDAVWWWMQALQEYCSFSPEGTDILKVGISRRFPFDEQDACRDGAGHVAGQQLLVEIVQEVFEKHAAGIAYREWNAGAGLDGDMSHEGFNVNVHLDPKTGLIHGGSKFNCGTWMDKMGSSARAGNKGHPATPRDGADVEIIGLLKSALRWIVSLMAADKFPYKGVQLNRPEDGPSFLGYRVWNDLLQASFEAHFWLPMEEGQDGSFLVHREWVNRRGIYKDTVGSSAGYTDYQLRPNFCVAMAVAPELFRKERAQHALKVVEDALLGGLGMRTLDPSDWKYRPNYVNNVDSEDYATSKGYNYHQGPEWVWCVGYFLRAKLLFAGNIKKEIAWINRYLARHRIHLSNSPWKGVTELANENGSHCEDSCPTQAWSASCLLDALYDMHNITSA